MLHFLLGIDSPKALETHPARGLSWEGFVIDQMISGLQRVRPASQAYFWRTATGQEVDLLFDHGNRRVPFEIKLKSAPTPDDAHSVRLAMSDLGMKRGYVIHTGRNDYSLGHGVTALPAEAVLGEPKSLARL